MSALKKPATCSLPDDPAALKVIIAEQAKRIAALEEYVMLEKIRKYAASSEKSPDQREMFNEAELAAMGIGPGTFRMSVGVDNVEDIKEDLDRALTACQ